ncbi:MAG: hypothetical protein FH749_05335 [Firmicutes bacterium]|nr:hypothetical protein [Bacillota bacterium]
MLRVLAAFMILAASTGLGFALAEGIRNRPRQLRMLQYGLTILLSEIRYRQTPLPHAFQLSARRLDAPVAGLFMALARGLAQAEGRGLYWVWQQTGTAALHDSALSQQDLQVVDSLMRVLGSGCTGEQERQLEMHLRHLQQEEIQAEKQREKTEKMWRYLGVLSGIALIIILL